MIVVGVDGSRAGLEAVAWAAREASLREEPLRVAHAMPAWAIEERTGRLSEVSEWMREGAKVVLDAGLERARREAPGVEADSQLLPGDAREALIAASGHAGLLVVGNHGLGGVRGLLVGSVAYGVAARAACDVVVVREGPRRGEIVVGVDGSPAGEHVLDFAFAEARLHGARLRAVHAWTMLEAGGGFYPVPDDLGLRETLGGRRESHPDVELIEEIVRGHAVEVLRQAAEGADLLVVGTRGQGQVAGLVFGSVSQAMLQQAPCSLAVVRTGAERFGS
ncbi:universal stress protein [Nonomuraea sp. NPDC050310]|uniref:universal stress protein n=1 Tax=Nonomuraea sp. NPDC050310 TaxID=3154935 RepID=UPI0033E30DFB